MWLLKSLFDQNLIMINHNPSSDFKKPYHYWRDKKKKKEEEKRGASSISHTSMKMKVISYRVR